MTLMLHDQRRFVITFVWLFAIALAGLSCSRIYAHRVINESTDNVYNVKVVSGDGYFMHGVITIGVGAGYGGSFKISGNDHATISWTDIQGKVNSYDVHVPRYAASKDVAFIIRNDGVDVEIRDR